MLREYPLSISRPRPFPIERLVGAAPRASHPEDLHDEVGGPCTRGDGVDGSGQQLEPRSIGPALWGLASRCSDGSSPGSADPLASQPGSLRCERQPAGGTVRHVPVRENRDKTGQPLTTARGAGIASLQCRVISSCGREARNARSGIERQWRPARPFEQGIERPLQARQISEDSRRLDTMTRAGSILSFVPGRSSLEHGFVSDPLAERRTPADRSGGCFRGGGHRRSKTFLVLVLSNRARQGASSSMSGAALAGSSATSE
jgi:hypothetical protein